MTVGHRTNRLKLVGIPEVEQLQNGRYQLTVNCTPLNKREAWYNSNKSRIFPDFGSLQSAEMSIDGLAPRTGEAYTDMRLVSVQSRSQGDNYIVTLVYQTLGSSFVQVKDDTVDLELNGLRRVTRTSIAQAGTDIPTDDKDIGVDFIDHQIDAETAVRCFLASYEVDDNDSFREFTRTYIEAGTLSVSSRNLSEGVKQVTTTFLVTEGSTTGPIISKNQDNFQGLKTISVANLQDRAGNSLIASDPNLVHSYEQLVDFKFPGEVSIGTGTDTGGGLTIEHKFYDLKPPITKKVEAQVNVFFQTEANILPSDFTFRSSQSLWNPTSWAEGKIKGLATNFALTTARPMSETKAFVGYTSTTTGAVTVTGGTGANVTAIEGKIIAPSSSASIEVSGGPGVPSGKYVLDVKIVPAFEDFNGNLYFKKTIVTATV
tara:strand:+ start:244 stop:1533 length:1290 start_codon:yes stop_codon:yes gene_type:complete